jgi:hypothetical protein
MKILNTDLHTTICDSHAAKHKKNNAIYCELYIYSINNLLNKFLYIFFFQR